MADLVEGALATLRDPALAVEFTLSGQVIISGTTFDSEGTITVVGPDLAGTYELQPFDIRSSEVSAGGKVWLRSGDGRWTRDDQLPAAVPTLASAFQGTPGVEHWEEMTVESTRLIRAELNGVNLDGLLAALGMADPGTTGARGTVALMVTPAGALAAIQFDNVIHSPGEGIEPEEMTRTLTVERLATAGEAGAPDRPGPRRLLASLLLRGPRVPHHLPADDEHGARWTSADTYAGKGRTDRVGQPCSTPARRCQPWPRPRSRA